MNGYSIWVLEYSHVFESPTSSIVYFAHNQGTRFMPYGYVLLRGNGHNVIVDVGFNNQAYGGELAKRFNVVDWQSPRTVLAEVDLTPEDIDTIICTHAHFDHFGNTDAFPNATFYLQERELTKWVSAMTVPPEQQSFMVGIDPNDIVRGVELARSGRLKLLDGDVQDLLPGLNIWAAHDTHTFGCMWVDVQAGGPRSEGSVRPRRGQRLCVRQHRGARRGRADPAAGTAARCAEVHHDHRPDARDGRRTDQADHPGARAAGRGPLSVAQHQARPQGHRGPSFRGHEILCLSCTDPSRRKGEAMDGLMQDEPLLLSSLLWRAERLYHDKQIITRTGNGSYHRYTYADFGRRVRRLANALGRLGVRAGDRVSTLAWNHYRHLEAYYAVPGMGATLQTVNMRLFEEQQAYTINHAGSSVLLLDPDQISVVERLVQIGIPQVEAFVVMTDGPLPANSLSPVYSYEELMGQASDEYEFPVFDENTAAAICYTSATTGDPKGVAYSHRALVLQSLLLGMNGMLGVSESSVWMPVAPMFHANAWCVPHACVAQGATIALTGEHPLDRDYLAMIEDLQVTGINAAVTVGQMMRDCIERGTEAFDLSSLKLMWLGAQAPPRGLLEWWERHNGTRTFTGYGMTESSPQVCFNSTKTTLADDSEDEQWRRRCSGGLPLPLMRIKIVDTDDRELPWDGESVGTVCLRSPYTARGYLDLQVSADHRTDDGWFRTGDVATVDRDGYVTVKDRVKDLIKSGGEWISSIDLENALMSHPGIREAMVVAVAHPKWQERPVALVVLRDDAVTEPDLRSYLGERFAKWWIPDDFLFVDALPKTNMGKFDKRHARQIVQRKVEVPSTQ